MARAKNKRKTYRSLNFTPPPEKKQIQTWELVLTLAIPDGDVIKIEKLDKSGQRREVSDEEFAAVAGADGIEELGQALEEAYAAGITDAINNELSEADEDEAEEEEILRRFILKRAAGRQRLRRGVRRSILRQLVGGQARQRRASQGKAGRSETKPA